MPIVIKKAGELLAAIDELLTQLVMARRPREILEDSRDGVKAVYDQLVDLHENWVPLDIAVAGVELTPARLEWEALPAGRLSAAEGDARKLLDSSPTLRAMHKGGVTFLDFFRFDAERRSLAVTVGDAFGDWHTWWDRFKLAVTSNDYRLETSADDFPSTRGFLDAMIRAGVLSTYTTWVYYRSDRQWARIKPDKIRFLKQGAQRIGIEFDVLKSGLVSFLNGDWLTAYAYQIIDDHLSRNKIDYEIYSQVRYEAPPDVLRVSGDFDVLARAGGRALLIECKSGRIRRDGDRDDYAQIAAKADGFRRVLEKTRAEVADIEFLLVFNPYLSPEEEVLQGFVDTRVRPIRPDEIRGTIMDMFRRP